MNNQTEVLSRVGPKFNVNERIDRSEVCSIVFLSDVNFICSLLSY